MTSHPPTVPQGPLLLGWRERPGILGQHASSPQSVHALLGYFLRDRGSPTPFPGRDRLAREGMFDWGLAPPLEKVIERPEHLQALMQMPELYRHSVSVIEPWPNIGTNPRGEPVRASKNIAYVLQQVADADTILYPVWRSGIQNAERLSNILSAGIATIVQGGNPSVHDASSFDGGRSRRLCDGIHMRAWFSPPMTPASICALAARSIASRTEKRVASSIGAFMK